VPRACSVCTHPERAAIDAALAEEEPYRHIAARFGASATALRRHKADHLPAGLTLAHEAADAAQADDLLAQLRDLQARTLRILATAEAAGDLRTALGAIGQARSNLELLAKLLGELNEAPRVNLTISPEWGAVRAVLLEALGPFPAARVRVAERLVALEGVNGHARS